MNVKISIDHRIRLTSGMIYTWIRVILIFSIQTHSDLLFNKSNISERSCPTVDVKYMHWIIFVLTRLRFRLSELYAIVAGFLPIAIAPLRRGWPTLLWFLFNSIIMSLPTLLSVRGWLAQMLRIYVRILSPLDAKCPWLKCFLWHLCNNFISSMSQRHTVSVSVLNIKELFLVFNELKMWINLLWIKILCKFLLFVDHIEKYNFYRIF